MRKLFHFELCPYSRKVRILLAEKGLDFELVSEKFWERRQDFSYINPAMQVPVLMESDNNVIADSYAISEYLEEQYDQKNFLGNSVEERANVRRLISWFDHKFFNEVTAYILNEKVIKYFTRAGEPHSEALRASRLNLIPHLQYISFLTQDHKWLAGDRLTNADIAAAAQISVLDYLGAIPWDGFPKAKEWYSFIKSRPSFREILKDKINGFRPPNHYTNLDF